MIPNRSSRTRRRNIFSKIQKFQSLMKKSRRKCLAGNSEVLPQPQRFLEYGDRVTPDAKSTGPSFHDNTGDPLINKPLAGRFNVELGMDTEPVGGQMKPGERFFFTATVPEPISATGIANNNRHKNNTSGSQATSVTSRDFVSRHIAKPRRNRTL